MESKKEIHRRSFFGLILAGGTGFFTVKGLLSRLAGPTGSHEKARRPTVTRNPLAVPRTGKGSHGNG